MARKFTPKNSLTISRDEQVKAYLHPVRTQILGFLTTELRTVSSIAKQLAVHPANITHHFKLLEKVGLIRLVEERDIGRVVEKYYRAVALHFEIRADKGEVTDTERTVLSMLRVDLNCAIHEYSEITEHQIMALLARARISDKQFAQFSKKLVKLVEEFQVKDDEAGTLYHLNLGLYPSDKDYGPIKKMVIK